MTASSTPVKNPVPIAGVHHTARPTWKLAETVHFYRDLLGLPLVHAISLAAGALKTMRTSCISSLTAATAARSPSSTT